MNPNLPRVLSGMILVYFETPTPSHSFVSVLPHSHPETFECIIEPRFGNTVDLILQTSAAREI